MEFQQKMITILNSSKKKPIKIEASIGVGTGLAYHHPVGKDGKQLNSRYCLTHVPTGYTLSRLTLPTELEVQIWLAEVARADPDQWNITKEQYMERYYYSGHVHTLIAKVELAHFNAEIPHDEYCLFPMDDDDEPNDDIVEARSADPEDETTKESVARLFSYSQLTVRVILASFNQATGKHTDLHTYDRPAAVEAQNE